MSERPGERPGGASPADNWVLGLQPPDLRRGQRCRGSSLGSRVGGGVPTRGSFAMKSRKAGLNTLDAEKRRSWGGDGRSRTRASQGEKASSVTPGSGTKKTERTSGCREVTGAHK